MLHDVVVHAMLHGTLDGWHRGLSVVGRRRVCDAHSGYGATVWCGVVRVRLARVTLCERQCDRAQKKDG